MPVAFLLDANIFRLYREGDATTVRAVESHISAIALSSVTVEEMIVGRLNIISRARSNKAGIPLPVAHEAFAEL